MDCAIYRLINMYVFCFLFSSFLLDAAQSVKKANITFAHFKNSFSLMLAPGARLSPVCQSIWLGWFLLQLPLWWWSDEISQLCIQQPLFLLPYLVVFMVPIGPSFVGWYVPPAHPQLLPLPFGVPSALSLSHTTATTVPTWLPLTLTVAADLWLWCLLDNSQFVIHF